MPKWCSPTSPETVFAARRWQANDPRCYRKELCRRLIAAEDDAARLRAQVLGDQGGELGKGGLELARLVARQSLDH
jgi:hypothetical protein